MHRPELEPRLLDQTSCLSRRSRALQLPPVPAAVSIQQVTVVVIITFAVSPFVPPSTAFLLSPFALFAACGHFPASAEKGDGIGGQTIGHHLQSHRLTLKK
jgi:hypothetical protein